MKIVAKESDYKRVDKTKNNNKVYAQHNNQWEIDAGSKY